MAKLRGWKFPVDVDQTTGKIMTVEDNENIKQSVKIILQTEKGERRMLPSFGSRLSRFMFENIDPSIKKMLTDEISRTLNNWEEHLKDLSINVAQSDLNISSIVANIEYSTDIHPYERDIVIKELNGQSDFDI